LWLRIVGRLRKELSGAGRSLREVFRNPALRRIQLAWAGSIVGDWAYATAFSLYAYEQGGPTALGVVAVVRYVLRALITPFTSVLGDKYPRRLVMIGSDLTAAVLIVVAAILISADANAYLVYALAVITSLSVSPFRPAQASYLPEVANSAEELAAANVASSTIESVGFFAGPAIAGLMLAFTSITTVYIFDAVTFAWSAFLVLGIRRAAAPSAEGEATTPESESAEESRGLLAEASAGFRVIFGNRDLRLLAALFCAQTVVAGASVVFSVSIALGLLGLSRSGLGYLNATLGIGGLIGGFLALVLVQRGRLARDFGIGVFLWSAPLILVAAWPTVTAAVIVMVLLGLANSIVDINGFTIIQRIAPAETMSRVFGALESAFIAGMAIGALLMPLLIKTIGTRWGLVVVGAGVACTVGFGAAGLRRIDTVALVPPGLELLRSVSILSVLPEPTLDRLARALVRVEAQSGDVVIREGDEGDRFYVIESGTVAITKEGRHVTDLGPGDFVGEIALLRNVPRVATVIATSELVLQALDRQHFIPAVTGQGEFGEAMDVAMSGRLAML
jgi:MFS family permease